MASNSGAEQPSSPRHGPARPGRNRIIQTCLPCHRTKRKCNRKKPCSQCLKSQNTRSCIYEAIAHDDLEALQSTDNSLAQENESLRSRIADLEAAMIDYKTQLRSAAASSGTNKRKRTLCDKENGQEEDKEGVYYGRSYYLGSAAAPHLLQCMLSLVPRDQSDLLFAFSGFSNDEQSPQSASPKGMYTFPTLFSPDQGAKEMLSVLHGMGKEYSDNLLDAYYDVVDPLHHYVPVPWLVQRYERCWGPHSDSCTPQELALVFVILSLGDLVTANTRSRFLISASFQLLRVSNFLANPSMDCIHTFCYIAVYLQHEGKLGEYWPMLGLVIRLAQSLALHRDPGLILKLSPEEGELRRRTFWTVAAQETALSSMFGRPNGIGFTDCKLPKDISDDELFGGVDGNHISSGTSLNEISYNRFTWELGAITREMLKSASQDQEAYDPSKTHELELRIQKWCNSLPAHFQFYPNTKTVEAFDDPESRVRFVQSIILHMIAKHNILVLYRKPLLSTKPCTFAKKPCFEAAFSIADSWKVLQDNFPKMARITWMHWFRAFHAALICLVAIRADGPRSEFRSRALTCWMSCLRIFARIKDQNQSIMSCWRALNRLDVVAKKEIETNRGPRSYNNHKSIQDSTSHLRINSSEEPRLIPSSSEAHGMTASNDSDALSWHHHGTSFKHYNDTLNVASAVTPSIPSAYEVDSTFLPVDDSSLGIDSNDSPPNYPGMNLGLQDFNMFDMDIQNWPSWLTVESSPQIT